MDGMHRKPDSRSGVFFFFFGLMVCFFSIHLGPGKLSAPGPGFLPLTAGILLVFLSLLLLLSQLFSKKAGEIWETKIAIRNVILVIGGMWVYAFLLPRIGFVFITFLFVTMIIRFVDPQSWAKSLIAGAASAAVSFLLFDTMLKTNLPRTFLGFF
jgi:hypothetical protein